MNNKITMGERKKNQEPTIFAVFQPQPLSDSIVKLP